MTKNLSPAEKKGRVDQAFAAKVAILEQWARDGVPEGAYVPRNHAALRRWTGPDGSLAIWKFRLVDKPGTTRPRDPKREALSERFRKAVESIDLRLKKSKKARVGALESNIAVLRRENDELRRQNMQLMGDIAKQLEKIQSLTDQLAAHKKSNPEAS